ncbi:MAG: putative porin [Chthoniobacteraceae bacterium]|nr:putative porin [Chthoniobacteraceae bacterium]
MSQRKRLFCRRFALALASSWCAAAGPHVLAADPAAANPLPSPTEALAVAEPPVAEPELAPAAPVAAPSQNVTINLINRLVQRGVLSKEDSEDLIKQAEADAAMARTQAAAAAQSAPAASDDAVRVTYIPEVVKDQIRDDLRQEVMKQAYEEKWAAPRSFPSWVTNLRLFGDLRVRYQGDFFPDGNDNTGGLPNFNAINTGSPFDLRGYNYPPMTNADRDRNRFRLRARAGAEADLGEGFTIGLRLGTGENNSPVSANQTMGSVNSTTANQGGNFSKYSVWLDRGFLQYETNALDDTWLSASVGRFDNPFFSTKMIWADDLGFDGAVVRGKYKRFECVQPFFVAGAFPVYNTDFNFASNQPGKFGSEDKWLEGFQLGADVKITKDWNAKGAVAYYLYQGVDGRLSDPFIPLSTADIGDTDATRPSFAQRGNTYMALRDIDNSTAANGYGSLYQYQYYGLATPFRDLALTGQIDYGGFDPFHIALTGEAVKNVAFNGGSIDRIAVNNRGADRSDGSLGSYAGGDTGWLVNLNFGSPALVKRWDWNVNVGYRYVESDAVIDGFCDSDFGGGGTNLKGFTFGGGLGLSSRVWVALRWLSADSIAGPAYKNDIIQFDINAKF